MTRSTCGRALQAWPWLEREPRIHWMADRNSEKVRRQRSQEMVVL